MRLRQALELIDEALPSLEGPKSNQTSINGQQYVRVVFPGRKELYLALDLLRRLGWLKPFVEAVANLPILSLPFDNWDLTVDQFNSLAVAMANLRNAAHGVAEALRAALPKPDALTVAIKLPDDIHDLPSLSAICDRLNQLIEHGVGVLAPGEEKPTPKLKGFDTGTLWLEVTFTAVALSAFGTMTKVALQIAKRWLEYRALAIQLKLYEGNAESLTEIRKLMSVQTRRLIEAETEAALNPEVKPEEKQRLWASIEREAVILTKGMEIDPPLSDRASKDKKDTSFPSKDEFEALRLLISQTATPQLPATLHPLLIETEGQMLGLLDGKKGNSGESGNSE